MTADSSRSQSEQDSDGELEEEEEVAPPPGTPISKRKNKRKRRPEGFYHGVRRRKRRQVRHGYMETTRGMKRKFALREGIEVGSATIERIVQGRYEWRDTRYKRPNQNRVWDPGGGR